MARDMANNWLLKNDNEHFVIYSCSFDPPHIR